MVKFILSPIISSLWNFSPLGLLPLIPSCGSECVHTCMMGVQAHLYYGMHVRESVLTYHLVRVRDS